MVLFKNRQDAGERLAKRVEAINVKKPIVLGIPRGGIEVGYPIAHSLSCDLEPITLRKLPIPETDQMGFGVVTLDKEVILNRDLLQGLFLEQNGIDSIVEDVYSEVLRRDKVYRGNRRFPELSENSVIITDDGLATGYTMLGALRFARAEKR